MSSQKEPGGPARYLAQAFREFAKNADPADQVVALHIADQFEKQDSQVRIELQNGVLKLETSLVRHVVKRKKTSKKAPK